MAENDKTPESASETQAPDSIGENEQAAGATEADAASATEVDAASAPVEAEIATTVAEAEARDTAEAGTGAAPADSPNANGLPAITPATVRAAVPTAPKAQEASIIDAAFEPVETGTEGSTPSAGQATDAILRAARSTAEAGGKSINEGITALKEVSAAKKAHGEGLERLEGLEDELAQLGEALARRKEVEANYDDIIRVQGVEVSEAASALAEAQTREAQLAGEHAAKADELARLKEANEQRLAPYHKLMDEAKATLANAQGTEAQAKRALKTAQSQADSAERSHNSQLNRANRAVGSAESRLAKLQAKQTELRSNPAADAKEREDVDAKVIAALAQLKHAREEVQRIDSEGAQASQNAQTHLYTQRKSLEQAESDLEAAKENEQAKREEYERLRSEADTGEKELEAQVEKLAASIAKAKQDQEQALGRSDAARGAIEEAEQVHATPAETARIAEQLKSLEDQATSQRGEVERLSRELHQTRERTQRQRIIFFALVAAAAIVLILILKLVFG